MGKHNLAEQKLAEHKELMKLFDKYTEQGDKAKARKNLILAARTLREGSEIIYKEIDQNLEELNSKINESEPKDDQIKAVKLGRYLTTVPSCTWWLTDKIEAYKQRKHMKENMVEEKMKRIDSVNPRMTKAIADFSVKLFQNTISKDSNTLISPVSP